MKVVVVRQTPKVVVVKSEDAPRITVERATQQVIVKRDGLRGPAGPIGPQGANGADGAANLPAVLTGGSF